MPSSGYVVGCDIDFHYSKDSPQANSNNSGSNAEGGPSTHPRSTSSKKKKGKNAKQTKNNGPKPSETEIHDRLNDMKHCKASSGAVNKRRSEVCISYTSLHRKWFAATEDERKLIKDFWDGLDDVEKFELSNIDKQLVLNYVKKQQPDCSCDMCKQRSAAIISELDSMYDEYAQSLQDYSAMLFENKMLFDDNGVNAVMPTLQYESHSSQPGKRAKDLQNKNVTVDIDPNSLKVSMHRQPGMPGMMPKIIPGQHPEPLKYQHCLTVQQAEAQAKTQAEQQGQKGQQAQQNQAKSQDSNNGDFSSGEVAQNSLDQECAKMFQEVQALAEMSKVGSTENVPSEYVKLFNDIKAAHNADQDPSQGDCFNPVRHLASFFNSIPAESRSSLPGIELATKGYVQWKKNLESGNDFFATIANGLLTLAEDLTTSRGTTMVQLMEQLESTSVNKLEYAIGKLRESSPKAADQLALLSSMQPNANQAASGQSTQGAPASTYPSPAPPGFQAEFRPDARMMDFINNTNQHISRPISAECIIKGADGEEPKLSFEVDDRDYDLPERDNANQGNNESDEGLFSGESEPEFIPEEVSLVSNKSAGLTAEQLRLAAESADVGPLPANSNNAIAGDKSSPGISPDVDADLADTENEFLTGSEDEGDYFDDDSIIGSSDVSYENSDDDMLPVVNAGPNHATHEGKAMMVSDPATITRLKQEALDRSFISKTYLRQFAGLIFEQRVLRVYREHVAKKRQEDLLREIAETEARAQVEAARKQKEKEKKRAKKQAAKQLREEKERQEALEAQKKAEAIKLHEETMRAKRQELERQKEEERRKKIEERMKKLKLEDELASARKEAERQAKEREEAAARKEAEKRAKETEKQSKEAEKQAKERERQAKEREKLERKEKERLKKESEANEIARLEAALRKETETVKALQKKQADDKREAEKRAQESATKIAEGAARAAKKQAAAEAKATDAKSKSKSSAPNVSPAKPANASTVPVGAASPVKPTPSPTLKEKKRKEKKERKKKGETSQSTKPASKESNQFAKNSTGSVADMFPAFVPSASTSAATSPTFSPQQTFTPKAAASQPDLGTSTPNFSQPANNASSVGYNHFNMYQHPLNSPSPTLNSPNTGSIGRSSPVPSFTPGVRNMWSSIPTSSEWSALDPPSVSGSQRVGLGMQPQLSPMHQQQPLPQSNPLSHLQHTPTSNLSSNTVIGQSPLNSVNKAMPNHAMSHMQPQTQFSQFTQPPAAQQQDQVPPQPQQQQQPPQQVHQIPQLPPSMAQMVPNLSQPLNPVGSNSLLSNFSNTTFNSAAFKPQPAGFQSSPWTSIQPPTSASPTLDEIAQCASTAYKQAVSEGLDENGFVPSQVLFHLASNKSVRKFTQSEFQRACLMRHETIRDDVGLITHIKSK